MKEMFGSYIPDFIYRLVRIQSYTNEELLKNENEMSMLMMLRKAQILEDIHCLINVEKEKTERGVKKCRSTCWNLGMKMNVSQEEAEQYARKVRERQVGYWFENMEVMDI